MHGAAQKTAVFLHGVCAVEDQTWFRNVLRGMCAWSALPSNKVTLSVLSCFEEHAMRGLLLGVSPAAQMPMTRSGWIWPSELYELDRSRQVGFTVAGVRIELTGGSHRE